MVKRAIASATTGCAARRILARLRRAGFADFLFRGYARKTRARVPPAKFIARFQRAVLFLIISTQASTAIQRTLSTAATQSQAGRYDQAEATLRAGLRANPAAPVLERALGQLLFRAKYDSSEAGTLLAHAAKMLPRDPEAKHYYAQWAYLNSRDRICVQQEAETLALPGLNDLALLQMNTLLGMCQSRLEEAAGARKAFQRANEINARQPAYDPVAAFQYVRFLTRYEDDKAAQEIVDQILQKIPRFAPAHLEKAKHYDRSGDAARAIEEAKQALSSDGNDVNSERAAHVLLARCYSMLGNTVEAAKEQQWIEAHPNPETPRKPR